MKIIARITALAIVASLLAVAGVPAAAAHGKRERSYTVKVTNLTDNQILTPVVFAAHTARADIFDVGAKTSPELREIAENGNLAPLVAALEKTRGVRASGIGAGADGPLMPGTSRAFDFKVHRGVRLLSTAQMLVCTNDGFTGLDSVQLPLKKGQTVTVYAFAWDAGTEKNTDALDDLVPPCSGGAGGTGMSNPALATDGFISPHPGLSGEAAENFSFDPDKAVAVYKITRN